MGGKGGGGKPESMSANDMIRMAKEEGEINKALLRQQTAANRPTQVTPWGNTVWQDLGGDRWQQTVTIPEAQRRALEAQQQVGAGRSELAMDLLGRASEELGAPIDWQAMDANPVDTASDARQRAEDALYSRATSRLDPYWDQRQRAEYSKLWNQGLRPGERAWNDAWGNLERAQTDAYGAAREQAIAAGGAEAERDFGMDLRRRQQALAEALRRRSSTLNEISALTSGQQVMTPDMPSFAQQGQAATPDITGAAQAGNQAEWDRWSARQAEKQGLMAGVGSVAGAVLPFFL